MNLCVTRRTYVRNGFFFLNKAKRYRNGSSLRPNVRSVIFVLVVRLARTVHAVAISGVQNVRPETRPRRRPFVPRFRDAFGEDRVRRPCILCVHCAYVSTQNTCPRPFRVWRRGREQWMIPPVPSHYSYPEPGRTTGVVSTSPAARTAGRTCSIGIPGDLAGGKRRHRNDPCTRYNIICDLTAHDYAAGYHRPPVARYCVRLAAFPKSPGARSRAENLSSGHEFSEVSRETASETSRELGATGGDRSMFGILTAFAFRSFPTYDDGKNDLISTEVELHVSWNRAKTIAKFNCILI